jgi:hypothetical protein
VDQAPADLTTVNVAAPKVHHQAMFDRFLRRGPQPILNGPTACYPEVPLAFHRAVGSTR